MELKERIAYRDNLSGSTIYVLIACKVKFKRNEDYHTTERRITKTASLFDKSPSFPLTFRNINISKGKRYNVDCFPQFGSKRMVFELIKTKYGQCELLK